jgi:hypothetical protein
VGHGLPFRTSIEIGRGSISIQYRAFNKDEMQEKLLEPQNIEQKISNVEIQSFDILRFDIGHWIFNLLIQTIWEDSFPDEQRLRS